MTEIDYLRKHPIDFTVEAGHARVRLFACSHEAAGDEHPILRVDEGGYTRELPFSDVTGALGWMFDMAARIMFSSRDASDGEAAAAAFSKGSVEIAAAAVAYHNAMTAAIARAALN